MKCSIRYISNCLRQPRHRALQNDCFFWLFFLWRSRGCVCRRCVHFSLNYFEKHAREAQIQPQNHRKIQPKIIKNMHIIKKKTNPANTYAVVFPLLYLYCFSLSSVAFLARTRIACVATTTNATARNTKNKPYQYIRRRPAEPRKHQASAAQCHQPPIYEWGL